MAPTKICCTSEQVKMNDSPLNAALRQFEAVEANLVKLEKVLTEIEAAIPHGIAFGDNPEYEINCMDFDSILESLPKLVGWKPEITLLGLNEIAQNRLDASEIGEIEIAVSVERQISEPARLLREYRFRFNKTRNELIRDSLSDLIDSVDGVLRDLSREVKIGSDLFNQPIDSPALDDLKNYVGQIDTLLGSSVSRPGRWSELHRHMRFGMLVDLRDIIELDWPSIKSGLRTSLYGEREPVPVDIGDLGDLVKNKPTGPVATKLRWEVLSEEYFERLIFALISLEPGYENAEWLMKTNAPDRGRDLSVYRVHEDPLAGTIRQRVIIQCKHWQSKSVGPTEVATLREQMKLWEPPRVDVHIIATSGRFTSDGVSIIEKHNQSDSALRIEMWPESHLERLLASRPAIISEFSLR